MTDKTHGHPSDHRQLVLHALALLRRVGAAIAERQRTPFGDGFTFNHALIIHHLVNHGDATPSQLAEWMHVTRGTVTPAITRLEALGLVTRRTDTDDARKQWLTATPAGRKVAPQVEAKVLRPALKELKEWDPQELRQFVRGLERLLESPIFKGGDKA